MSVLDFLMAITKVELNLIITEAIDVGLGGRDGGLGGEGISEVVNDGAIRQSLLDVVIGEVYNGVSISEDLSPCPITEHNLLLAILIHLMNLTITRHILTHQLTHLIPLPLILLVTLIRTVMILVLCHVDPKPHLWLLVPSLLLLHIRLIRCHICIHLRLLYKPHTLLHWLLLLLSGRCRYCATLHTLRITYHHLSNSPLLTILLLLWLLLLLLLWF
jgi:hypothetical protein